MAAPDQKESRTRVGGCKEIFFSLFLEAREPIPRRMGFQRRPEPRFVPVIISNGYRLCIGQKERERLFEKRVAFMAHTRSSSRAEGI